MLHTAIHRPTLVDLFCGCGGFSLGAVQAGFRSLASIDVDARLQSAYRRNFPRTNAVTADAAALDGAAWERILGSERPDGVIGGPPCQGFSHIGLRDKGDPRNSLVHHFYRHVGLLRPRLFVMENVPGILDDGNIDILRAAIATLPADYVVHEPVVLNAAHFGAATARKRVVVFGYDRNECDAPAADFLVPAEPAVLATVRDAIADLPPPVTADKSNAFGWSPYPVGLSVSGYAAELRTHLVGVGSEEAIRRGLAGEVSGLQATRHTAVVIERLSSLPQGRTDAISRAPRLSWDGQCPTLRAGTGTDKGAFSAVRPIHPTEPRAITVREAARLMGYHDAYTFDASVWWSHRMIGNSLSPLFARGLMERVRALLPAREATLSAA